MSKLITTELSKYYNSLEDAKEDGYQPIKVFSVVQFYQLKGKHAALERDHFEPILYVLYVVLSPQEHRYYLKSFRDTPLYDIYFFETILPFKENEAIEQLKRYIEDGHVWLLLNEKQVEDIKQMLARVSKNNVNNGQVIKYRPFIQLCDLSLKREYFQEYRKTASGYKTQLNIFDSQIANIWKEVK